MALSMEWEKSKFGMLLSLQEAYNMRGASFRERRQNMVPRHCSLPLKTLCGPLLSKALVLTWLRF